AYPKAWYADFQSAITAGICDRQNGVPGVSLQGSKLGCPDVRSGSRTSIWAHLGQFCFAFNRRHRSRHRFQTKRARNDRSASQQNGILFDSARLMQLALIFGIRTAEASYLK